MKIQPKDRAAKRLPHERDEAPDPTGTQQTGPRAVIKQAASDIEQGLVDTDLHGTPGVERVNPKPARQARPRPDLPGKAS